MNKYQVTKINKKTNEAVGVVEYFDDLTACRILNKKEKARYQGDGIYENKEFTFIGRLTDEYLESIKKN